MKKLLLFSLLMAFVLIGNSQSHWTATQFLPDSVNPIYSASTGGEFAWSMAATETHVIVGTLQNEAVIYERNMTTGNLEAQAIFTPGVSGFTGYGSVVAIDDSVAVVGARNYQNNGAAFVYRLSGITWMLDETLTAADGASGDNFGRSVAVSGNNIVVGADGDDNGTGAVYLFSWLGGNWSEQDKFVAAGSNTGDALGSAVALKGDTMLCTAPNHYNGTVGFTGTGYATSILGGTVTHLQTLMAANDEWDFYDDFGVSAAIADDGSLLIGASGSSVSGVDCGAVYPWYGHAGAWSRMAPIFPETPSSGERFGTAIATWGDKVSIGSPGYNGFSGRVINGFLMASVYLPIQIMEAIGGGSFPSAGQSVALTGEMTLVGANYGQTYVGAGETGRFDRYEVCLDPFEQGINWSGNTMTAAEMNADSYTWYWIDNTGTFPFPVPTLVGNTASHTPTNGGRYLLLMTKNGCHAQALVHVSLVGTDALTSLELAVNPNPVSDVLFVNSTCQNGTLEVISVDGKVVKTVVLNGAVSVDVNDFEAGIYILRISESGQVGQTRFVKVE